MNQSKIDFYEKLGEDVYLWSFRLSWLYVAFVTIYFLWKGNINADLYKTVFRFVVQIVGIFVIPPSLKIVGDKIKYLPEIIRAWRSGSTNNGTFFSNLSETNHGANSPPTSSVVTNTEEFNPNTIPVNVPRQE